MLVDRALVLEDGVLLRSVRDGHDVDIAEFGAALAPVAMGEDVEASDLTAGFHLAARRYRPVKERVESRDAFAGRERLDMFQKCREASNHASAIQILGDLKEFLDRHFGLGSSRAPEVTDNFIGCEFALERRKHAPFERVQLDLLGVLCDRQLVRFAARRYLLPPHVSDAEGEDALGG